MKSYVVGDTINFKTTVHTAEDVPITDATVNLDVVDFLGSTVLSDAISHVGTGTYEESKSSLGWSNGPILQKWTVSSSSGTKTYLSKNQIKIVNAGTPYPTYVYVDELESYFPDIRDYLDNKSEDHVIAAYKYENRLIDSLGYHTPMKKNSDGFYDQSLRDFNAFEAIYRIINSNQANQVPADEEGRVWYDRFREDARMVYKDWDSKRITFKAQISPGEAGILPGTRTVGSSVGTMINNSDSAWGSGFRGADYTRQWSVEITGTGTSGGLRECEFAWSNDGGLGTYDSTTSDDWVHLQDQVYVRFTRGTSTSGTGLMVVGDKWEWSTNPVRDQVGGKNIAVGY